MPSDPDPRPDVRPEASTAQSDRRRAERHELHAPLELRLDAQHLEGLTENVSDVGALFFSDQSLCVTVRFEQDGVTHSHTGRLVRAQRMSADRIGYAIEFDAD